MSKVKKQFFQSSFWFSFFLVILISCQQNENQDGGPSSKSGVKSVLLVAKAQEVSLISGEKTKAWTYNGTVPGPLIEANVGDTLEVTFENQLPESSTIHWHGLELPANMDGSNIAQEEVKPGESFVYRFKLLREGTYWYHPHINNSEQLERGLYGALIVKNPYTQIKYNLPLNDQDHTVILDDILVDSKNQIMPFEDKKDPIIKATHILNGRLGNKLLVNGKNFQNIPVKQNSPVRLRFINAANSRFFYISFDGKWSQSRIAGDAGLLEHSLPVLPIISQKDKPNSERSQGILLTPGDRAEILIIPSGELGDSISLFNFDFKRGIHEVFESHKGDVPYDIKPARGDGFGTKEKLLTLTISKPNSLPAPLMVQKLEPFSGMTYQEVQIALSLKPLKITFGHSLPDKRGDIVFFAKTMMKNGKMQGIPMGQIKDSMALNAKVGETRILEITNLTAAIHPFHIHGFPFIYLDTTYIDLENEEACEINDCIVKKTIAKEKEWMDTISIDPRPGFRGKSHSITRLAIKFDDKDRKGQIAAFGKIPSKTRSGGWLAHCHVLEHAEKGMATYLNLTEP